MKFPEEYRYLTTSAADGKKPLKFLYASRPGDPYGLFHIPSRATGGRAVQVIACDGTHTGWEHVSVTLADQPGKAPSWPEMCAVKALFWDASECVVQYHPPSDSYVNQHDGCLHLWRRSAEAFPMPPIECV